MPEIALDDSDRHMLRQCPLTIVVPKGGKQSKAELARMRRVKRLWAARLVHGGVESDLGQQTLRITLTEAGRKAIGLPNLVPANG